MVSERVGEGDDFADCCRNRPAADGAEARPARAPCHGVGDGPCGMCTVLLHVAAVILIACACSFAHSLEFSHFSFVIVAKA